MPLLPVTPASHHCGEAVAEFHKVIDYPGIVVNEPSVHYLISNSDEPTANPATTKIAIRMVCTSPTLAAVDDIYEISR